MGDNQANGWRNYRGWSGTALLCGPLFLFTWHSSHRWRSSQAQPSELAKLRRKTEHLSHTLCCWWKTPDKTAASAIWKTIGQTTSKSNNVRKLKDCLKELPQHLKHLLKQCCKQYLKQLRNMLCTENILLCTETILLCTETILLCTDFFRTLFPQLFAKLFKIDHKIFQFISKSFFQFQSFFQKTELATVQGSAATFLDAMRYLLVQVLATQAFCKVIHLKASHTDMELSLVFTPASSVQPSYQPSLQPQLALLITQVPLGHGLLTKQATIVWIMMERTDSASLLPWAWIGAIWNAGLVPHTHACGSASRWGPTNAGGGTTGAEPWPAAASTAWSAWLSTLDSRDLEEPPSLSTGLSLLEATALGCLRGWGLRCPGSAACLGLRFLVILFKASRASRVSFSSWISFSINL